MNLVPKQGCCTGGNGVLGLDNWLMFRIVSHDDMLVMYISWGRAHGQPLSIHRSEGCRKG